MLLLAPVLYNAIFFFLPGLGTSTSKEAKEYFVDMIRHRIVFNYSGAQDDHSIQMVRFLKLSFGV